MKTLFYWNPETLEAMSETLSQGDTKQFYKSVKEHVKTCHLESDETPQDLESDLLKQVIYFAIEQEIERLTDSNYWGTSEEIDRANAIYDYFIEQEIVNELWFEERYKYTDEERFLALIDKL